MQTHTRVAVIGGGVVGCSVLYHLTRFGWTDVLLLERSELTSGSTWHAAGGMHTINGDPNVAKLQKYTVELYREIEAYSGQDIGLHMTGGVMLAATEARFDWLKSIMGKGRYAGLDAQIITPKEAHELMPLLDPDQFVGALYDEVEGHLDPYGTTHAYAKSAVKNGAKIELHTQVVDLQQRADGSWDVVTDKGTVNAEHVVNAAGLWAREVGRMCGLELPVLAMEHMYLITEDMPEVIAFNEASGKEMLHAVDFDGELYLRQERKGMLMGTYEKNCKPWSPKQTPWSFGHELLNPDLDRITDELEVGFSHFPAFNDAGIKQIINGPFTFAPDGNPLVGPVSQRRNLWSACAVMAGFSQGGGVGLALANWMIEGDPGFDVFAMDIARYGDFTSPAYTNAKVRENYSRRFSISFPNEELPAARPLRTTPIHDRLEAHGARFTVAYGLEVPLWYAPDDEDEQFSWYRSTDFDTVGEEVAAVRQGVGMMDISGFANYRIDGANAESWLDSLLACKLPAIGRMTLAPMLKADGCVVGDFTLARLDEQTFMLVGSGAAKAYHLRWFEQQLGGAPLFTGHDKRYVASLLGSRVLNGDGVQITDQTSALVGLSIAGPHSRQLLQIVSEADVSHEAFTFMAVQSIDIGMTPVIASRVSFTGDLGYELWMSADQQRYVFDVLMEAGKDLGIRLFGARALNALRLEKGYGSWAREYRPVYNPFECELDRFICFDKAADFVGKEAVQRLREEGGGPLRLRIFLLDVGKAGISADAIGDEPISHNGKVCGWVTSGGFAHGSGVSVALGYVPQELASSESGWEIELLGVTVEAQLLNAPLFDANGSRMRS